MKLTDWKVTSVYSFLLSAKPEWEAQLNCYAWLYRQNGFVVTKLQIVAILRDWMRSRTNQDTDYPPCAVMVVDIPMWSLEDAEKYIYERVKLHQDATHLDDSSLGFCTPEERWERPTTWAMIKKGNKKATKVYPNMATLKTDLGINAKAADFDTYTHGQNVYDIVKRPGESVRCANYCKAAPWCNQFLSL